MRNTYKPLILAAAALTALSACGSSTATTTKTTTKPAAVATAKTTVVGNTGSTAPAANGSATTVKGGSTTTAKAGSSGTLKPADAATAWAKCMRDNGITVADPTIDAKGNPQIQPPKDLDVNSPKAKAAMDACQKYFKDIQVGSASQADMKEAMVAFSACLRKQGLDVGDADLTKGPGAGGSNAAGQGSADTGGIPMEVLASIIPRFDPKDPKSAPAVKACASVLSKVTGAQAGA
jgi:hypothetical protein